MNEDALPSFRKEMREISVTVDPDDVTVKICQPDFGAEEYPTIVIAVEQIDLLVEWLKEARDSLKGRA